MKKYLLALGSFFFFISYSIYAQQSNTIQNVRAIPSVINFSSLSAYQLKHPIKNRPPEDVEQGEERDKKYKFKPRPVPASAVTYNIDLPKRRTRAVSPAPDISFNGTLDNDYLSPPDINGVIGDSLIMETTNQEFDIFTKGGLLLEAVDLNSFFASVGTGFVFDPHLVYDAKNKKYIVCVDCLYNNGHGGILLGVTQTSNPTGNWNLYGFDVMKDPGHFLDFPMVGYNKNWIVVTTNNYINDTVGVAQIDVFNKDSMYTNSSVTANQFIDSNIISLSPAATDDQILNTEYLVADWNGDSLSNGYIRLGLLAGTANSPVYTPGQVIGINHPWSEELVEPSQLGDPHTFYSVDTRVDFAKYINGSLWFSHTVFLPASSPTYDAVDWWQVDPATSVVQQFGRVEDATGNTFYFFPSINVNANNDALLGYATSSYTSYIGAGYVYRSATDAQNSMENGYSFQPGLAPYFKDHGGGQNRWGDFTGTAVDPSNNSFWTFQEYANLPANNWGTVIANVGAPTCNNTPIAGFILAAKDTICNGAKAILQLYGNTIAANDIEVQWQQSLTGTGGWNNVNSSISTVASQFVSSPLNQTTYFRCRVSCLNSNKTATSEPVTVPVFGLMSVSNDTVCIPGKYNIIAKALGNTKWYSTAASATPISTGDTLKATITGDSTFYLTIGNSGSDYITGITDSTIGTGGKYTRFDEGLEFTALNDFIIDSVFVYPYSVGTIIVNLADNKTNIVLQSDTFTVKANAVGQKTRLPLDMSVVGGADYKLNAVGTTDSGLFRTNSGLLYPYEVSGIISINRAINFQQAYYYFYDWHLSTTCRLNRIPVHIAIDTAAVTISTMADTLCKGDSIMLSGAGAAAFNWMPGNINGSSVTVKPSNSTTYSVTGINMYGCSGSAVHTIVVKDCTTEVSADANTSRVKIYPDPSSGIINVLIEGVIPADSYLEIDNILGQKLFLNPVGAVAMKTFTIDVSSFTAGIYFFLLKSGNEKLTEGKLVKE